MLRIDVRELRKGPVPTRGTLPPQAPLFAGLGVALADPVEVSGLVELRGRNDYFWRGQLASRVWTTCRRCGRELLLPIEVPVEALFSANPDLQDDPSVYPLTEPVSHVDVSEAAREELALAVPPFPLCKEDCAGLCRVCGADLNLGPCGCLPPVPNT
jgi:uncharacterized protein